LVVLGDVYTVSSFPSDGTDGQNNPGIAEVEKLLNDGLTQNTSNTYEWDVRQ
jgi:hypothetical protein